MALIKCTECGHMFSDKASVCPNCGCPSTNGAVPTSAPSVEVSEKAQQRVRDFLDRNRGKLPQKDYDGLYDNLLSLNDSQWDRVTGTELKDPTNVWLISFFLGVFGVDRFMIGDSTGGTYKLLLWVAYIVCLFFNFSIIYIGIVIWWIADLINIKKMTREYNLYLLQERMNNL